MERQYFLFRNLRIDLSASDHALILRLEIFSGGNEVRSMSIKRGMDSVFLIINLTIENF